MRDVKLTDKYIENIKPEPGKRLEFFDDKVKGLCLRVTEKGRKSWSIMYRVRHIKKLRRYTLGTYPIMKLKVARERATASNGRQGYLFGAQGRGSQPGAVDEYIDTWAKPNTKNWKKTKQIFDRECMSVWGHRPVASITRNEAAGRINRLVKQGKPGAARNLMRALRAFFNWCVETGYLESSPILKMKSPVKKQIRERVLTNDELRTLWNACIEIGYPWGDICRLLILTGVRPGEICNLRKASVRSDGLYLDSAEVKTKCPEIIPLTQKAKAILDDAPILLGGYIYTSGNKKPVTNSGWFKDMLERHAEITEYWQIRDIRRTVRTNMAALRIPNDIIDRTLRHQISGIQAHYDWHDYFDEKLDALRRWEARLMQIVEPNNNIVELRVNRIVGARLSGRIAGLVHRLAPDSYLHAEPRTGSHVKTQKIAH